MDWGQVVGIFGDALDMGAKVAGIYSTWSGIARGKDMDQVLELLRRNEQRWERLSDHILWAPESTGLLVPKTSKQILEAQRIAHVLAPIQKIMKGDILASSLIATPDEIQRQFEKNMWDFFYDVRPFDPDSFRELLATKNNEDIPALFMYGTMPFVGFQKRLAFKTMTGVEVNLRPEAWVNASVKGSAKRKQPQKQKQQDDDFHRAFQEVAKVAAEAAKTRQAQKVGIRTGKVKFYRRTFGFIMPDDGGADVYVHTSALEAAGIKELKESQRVRFVIGPGKGDRQQATKLTLLA